MVYDNSVKTFSEIFEWEVSSGTGCWLCTSHKPDSNGYARVMVGRKKRGIHRFSYEYHKGDIPCGMVVRHKCDNRLCINPDHLEVGTNQENSDDMVIRGREKSGENNPRAKLKNSDIKLILTRLDIHDKEMGDICGVSSSVVANIRSGKQWRRTVKELGLTHLTKKREPNQKLGDEEVRVIINSTEINGRQMAKIMGVSEGLISHIRNGKLKRKINI